jgi:hypothetical protein
MAQAGSRFRRAVLGLQHHPSRHGLSMAVDVARLLGLDLFGLFVEDESLLHLAALPFAREFNPLGGWRAVDGAQLIRDLQAAASSAQRSFAEAVKSLPTSCEFVTVRGSMAEAISAHARPDDIVMLSAPAAVGEYSAGRFPPLIDTALQSAAAVLLIPRQIARHAGDVVAIAARPDDPSIRLAAGIARAANEELVIIELFDDDAPDRSGRPDDARATRKVARAAVSDPTLLVAAFRGERERLVVVTHGTADPSLPTILASWRRVPVLVIAAESQAQAGAESASDIAPS